MNVVIIDSGLSELESNLLINHMQGIAIEKNGAGVEYSSEYGDNWGHGTIVANILVRHLKSKINLFVINIFKQSLFVDVDLLVEALKYCDTIECDLIQISLGVLYSDKRLNQIIKKLTEKGVIIVSAFDNDKSMSYPAAYDEVIGVDVSSNYKNIDIYSINENNIVDVIGADIYYRSKGIDEKKTIVRGSSFYTSYISAQIVNMNLHSMNKCNIINELKKSAYKCHVPKTIQKRKLGIHRAIVFPFNKEVHSIAAFRRLLNFSVDGYYDIRQRGNVSRAICDILPYTDNDNIIMDYTKIDWELPFDSFICGHVGELSQLLKRDILGEIIEKCVTYKKRLFSFDNISRYNPEQQSLECWFPHMCKAMIPQLRYGKLRSPSVPILGVFGTSSNQGKMTLQLLLRDCLRKKGIKVKNIGSEPQSALFGFEYSYVFGYQSTDELTPEDMVLTLNEAVYELEKDNCDLIIAGSQSGTVANQLRNTNMLPLKQYYYLLGIQPDAVVLLVNAFDSIEYIERTISFINSTVTAKVISVVVSFLNSKKYGLKSHSLDYYASNLNVPVFNLHNINIEDLADKILEYYEE